MTNSISISTAWHYYCMFFHWNPAGFLFIHIMAILLLSALTFEHLSCKAEIITWLKRKQAKKRT